MHSRPGLDAADGAEPVRPSARLQGFRLSPPGGTGIAAEDAVELVARADVQLAEDLVKVVLNRARANEQPSPDLGVGKAVPREQVAAGTRLCRRQGGLARPRASRRGRVGTGPVRRRARRLPSTDLWARRSHCRGPRSDGRRPPWLLYCPKRPSHSARPCSPQRARGVDPAATAEEVMEAVPSTVRPSTNARELVERLASRDLAAAIVTTPEGSLIGTFRREDAQVRLAKPPSSAAELRHRRGSGDGPPPGALRGCRSRPSTPRCAAGSFQDVLFGMALELAAGRLNRTLRTARSLSGRLRRPASPRDQEQGVHFQPAQRGASSTGLDRERVLEAANRRAEPAACFRQSLGPEHDQPRRGSGGGEWG